MSEQSTDKFISKCGRVTLLLGDAEIAKTLDFDAIVTDPPYGVSYKRGVSSRKNTVARAIHREASYKQDVAIDGDDKPFDPQSLIDLGKPLLLWGANHFAARLPPGQWLAWDKRCGAIPSRTYADCELAWCNRKGVDRLFRHMWDGFARDSENTERRLHPTQKPVALMQWCLEIVCVKVGKTVLDPYMGSGSTGVACLRTGRNFVGIDSDRNHFTTACNRLQKELNQC